MAWTRPDDVCAALRRKWQSGALLAAFADGADWEPLGFPLRGPAPGEIGGRLGEVQDWAGEWERARLSELRVEYKKVGGRHVGSNLIPGRAWIDSYDQAWRLLGVLEPLGWLAGVDLVYWGDIDTHGFAILDRLRRRFPHARSMLMDRGTLLAHRSQWVTEPNPSAGRLDLLDAEESRLYQHLVADALGPSVRLEQERVSFAAIHQATPDV